LILTQWNHTRDVGGSLFFSDQLTINLNRINILSEEALSKLKKAESLLNGPDLTQGESFRDDLNDQLEGGVCNFFLLLLLFPPHSL
jgi:hypothetical protein